MLSRSCILRSKERSRRNKKTLIGSQSDRISVFSRNGALCPTVTKYPDPHKRGASHMFPSYQLAPFAFDLDAGETGGEGVTSEKVSS